MKKSSKDMFPIGLMVFSTFFGAGNLIFPPYLGMMGGTKWFIAFLGFIIGDVLLAVLAVIGTCKYDEISTGVLLRCGRKFAVVLSGISMLCVGPFLAIPRTGSVTFEISILPNLPQASRVLFAVIFFGVTLFLTLHSSKVVDILGKALTPLLLIALVVFIVRGIVSPLGAIQADAKIRGVFSNGLMQGYQTLDAVGGSITGILVIVSIMGRGYKDYKERLDIATKSSILAFILLVLVYGGLAYLGATVSAQYTPDVDQTTLLVQIASGLFGQTGKIVLEILVLLACLTTSVGLTSAVANYFTELTKGKLHYPVLCTAIAAFSGIMSLLGVQKIISLAVPILLVMAPVFATIIIFSVFSDKIKNNHVFQFGAYMALACGLLSVFKVPFMNSLPLSNLGFNWVIPTAVAAIAGHFVCVKEPALKR